MRVALTTLQGRLAACLPGAEVWVVTDDEPLDSREVVSTAGWQPLAWGAELMQRDIDVLLCTGIDRFVWGMLCGHGIRVVPNALGHPQAVLASWRNGDLAGVTGPTGPRGGQAVTGKEGPL